MCETARAHVQPIQYSFGAVPICLVFSQSGETYQRMFIGPNSFCATPIMVHDIHSKRARGPDILISQQLEVPLMAHRLS